MDMEQEEAQFLGFFGIIGEAYKVINSRRKIFSQITVSLIVPLSLLVLVHTEISEVLSDKILNNEMDLAYSTRTGTREHDSLVHKILSEWTLLFLFKAAYLTSLLVFSLLSTAAVVFTIAAVYTARNDLSFAGVMAVVPRVWKRLIVTFLWTFLAFFLYHVAFIVVLVITFFLLYSFSFNAVILVVFYALLAVYALGFVYLTLVWSLASVVSVLEEARGIAAMRKSKALMKGKMWTSILIFGLVGVCTYALQFAFQVAVVHGSGSGGARAVYGLMCLAVSVVLVLFGLVVQTILYFVCKSYHHENIDKSALSDHLEVYLGEYYVPLTAKDVQLEQYHV